MIENRFTRDQLLSEHSEHVIKSFEDAMLDQLEACAGADGIVFDWGKAPPVLRNICCYNGGDEDWVFVTNREYVLEPTWLIKMSSMEDPDIYVFDGVVIYVGSHS